MTFREMFLKSPVFDGKTFWEVEKELAWLDDSGKKEVIGKSSMKSELLVS